jgi:type II secretory ATPase GspE/PulE/Tfp pilus assembly ATPase PilB-like protein
MSDLTITSVAEARLSMWARDPRSVRVLPEGSVAGNAGVGRRPTRTERHDVADLVDDMLARGLTAGATDLHFEPLDDGVLVRVRVDGQLIDLELVPAQLADNVVSRLKVLASLLTYRVDIPQEGSFRWPGDVPGTGGSPTDLRVATFPTIRGERAVVRFFHGIPQLQSLDSLGMTTDQVELIRGALAQPGGFIVVSGPAGSGKTTTLYAMIRELRDRHPGRSVITLEDPVEQRIDRVTQIQINPHGELSYERCMRSLLRQDPQVLLLGEVRDRPTASVAVEAAFTGHLILTTVHSGDPAETIVRFLEMGIPSYQLTSALTLVCSQRLLRKTCRACTGASSGDCPACLGTGYAGRTAIAQIVEVDEPTRTSILRHLPASELREALRTQGSDLAECAAALVADGVTDEEEVARVVGATRR